MAVDKPCSIVVRSFSLITDAAIKMAKGLIPNLWILLLAYARQSVRYKTRLLHVSDREQEFYPLI
jgi:hypothetical protein